VSENTNWRHTPTTTDATRPPQRAPTETPAAADPQPAPSSLIPATDF